MKLNNRILSQDHGEQVFYHNIMLYNGIPSHDETIEQNSLTRSWCTTVFLHKILVNKYSITIQYNGIPSHAETKQQDSLTTIFVQKISKKNVVLASTHLCRKAE